ncbi:hypothetical protein [Mycoplasmopsis fermentans]|uniref:hypothetical protein n=1 Tax=Mycoplasma phage phiMFV1 TaxID=280702 RepID=UPI00003B49B0|nr:hypothetical protein [Mycoplasmopsis fermentans]YP_044798.1 hypothetical protein phiMFV1_p11 [Mycoplasma phage phiMFV1]AAT65027.1 hypothetical protein [Mycoplasma phage phiMFV1]AAT65066.1 hypothetical protein [Mycoplasma phage phiMFV1]RMX34463.1 hypothetical protein MFI2_0861 [Mycoplasmopsis fermentans MF-I2]RMX34480.1 hypothetical protein MFI1_0906 [Mycoplasmopsis fermentans MF-I1]
MHKIISVLSSKLGIEESELLKKLSLNENSSQKEIASSLGVYEFFQEKDDLTSFILNKTQNQHKDNQNLKTENEKLKNDYQSLEQQFNTNLENYKNLSGKVKDTFKNEWNKYKLNEIDFEKIDVNSINLNNLFQSVEQVAKENNITIKTKEPNSINNINQDSSSNSSDPWSPYIRNY